ncbi:hypothetical protein BFU36_09610 [Sulfolobus sp. A20]|nr:hypothetical protein BFU36_09610 [Sulfolobus sp. A20]TRM76889.1 hypothetical protein DJ532_06580 [Sulfolobus sp. A20-N-F8]TRM83788.1 hypothetical protein DJ522_05775 [Sulfolobus sp. F3]TRM86995.1 hypothetical protein DJ521_04440 [Sulfolobus sp. E3]TRM88177.1 hypothetical protein DJ529_06175 [Sulfolobus sp. C3]TRM94908.1 hypothetical protein DJ526_01330 [Sulfolobus sp. A20-N-G8]TRN02095.1 hypothetical protein DJ527_04455 [Sulfolobus sp. F1]TRN02947.1 hypothetical protein DJ530_03705 [Sulfo
MGFIPFIFILLIFPHAFVEYHVQTYIVSTKSFVDNLVIEEVTDVYSNGTFEFNITTVFLNFSEISSPSTIFDNLTCPMLFYYIPHPGKEVVDRQIPLTLVNETGNYYVYEGVSYIGYVGLRYYYYVNSTGVPSRIVIYQIGENGEVVSVSTYTLISSNLINSEEKIILPPNLRPASGITYLGNLFPSSLTNTIGSYIVLFNIIAIPILIVIKRKLMRKY